MRIVDVISSDGYAERQPDPFYRSGTDAWRTPLRRAVRKLPSVLSSGNCCGPSRPPPHFRSE